MGDSRYMVFLSHETGDVEVSGNPSLEEGFLVFRNEDGKLTASFAPGHWPGFIAVL